MKSIELNTAAVDNAGRRIEAGERIAVGTRVNQIDIDRAKDLVARAAASAVREKKAATSGCKPSGRKPATKPKASPAPASAPVPAIAPSADIAKP